MRNLRFGRWVVLLALVALLALIIGALPGAAQKNQPTFSGAAEVVAVEIPVQVIRDGEPVRGLKAEDFEVYDGRKKEPITGFEVLDLQSSGPAPGAAAGPAAAQVPVAGRRHFLLLFDLTFSEPRSIVRARSAAKDLLAGFHPSDLVAVATYSTLQGPQLVLGFTPDRKQAAVAIDTLGVPKLMERSSDPLRLAAANLTASLHPPSSPTGTAGGTGASADAKAGIEEALVDTFQGYSAVEARTDRARQADMVQRLSTSFGQLAKLMGGMSGRKYVVYLSQGFDSSLLSGQVDEEKEKQNQESAMSGESFKVDSEERFGNTKSVNKVEGMLDEFRRANCVIQAVDIAGLRAGADQGARLPPGKDSLLQMAKGTGGELYENFNNLSEAMGQMLKRTSVTYVLAIQPDQLKPGEYRKLKVELKNAPRGTRIVYRPGYYAPKAYAQQNPLEKLLETSSQLMGEDSGSVSAAVLAAPFRAEGGTAYVPVLIEVDGPSLLQGKQGPQLPVELYVYALDQNGGVTGFITQTFGLDLTKAEPALRQGGFKFFGHLDLPPGSYSIRVMVRNGTTGASGVRVAKLEVPAFGQGGPFLLPAFFPDGSNRWLMAREAQKPDQKQVAYPFMNKDQPYVPASRPLLKPGSDAAVLLVGYDLAAGQWKAEATVLSLDGKELKAGGLKLLAAEAAAAGGPSRAAASFHTPDLPPGEYLLKVTLVDGAGKSGSSVAHFAVPSAAGG
jgi:VWFA-related protein